MNSCSHDIEAFRENLRKHSLKATPQRLAVHRAMIRLGHASADMVHAAITAEGTTNVTVASVYNILLQLSEFGIYSRRMSAGNKMYFDVNTEPHIHLYDSENDSYKDVVDEDLMAAVMEHLGRRKFRGYKVDSIDIQIVARPIHRKHA